MSTTIFYEPPAGQAQTVPRMITTHTGKPRTPTTKKPGNSPATNAKNS